MERHPAKLINDPVVRASLKEAWEDSQPGVTGGHEEGGFILRDSAGNLSITRWPQGAQGSIILPLHADCKVGGIDIIASFHTHPNTGIDYLQQPSETDKRAVRDDIALSLAHAMATANKRARELGVDVSQSLITITQLSISDDLLWRINYGPKDYLGRRGGDLIIDIDPSDATIERVLWGQ